MAPKTQDPQALGTKEQGLFRQLIKQYEVRFFNQAVEYNSDKHVVCM